MHAILGEFNFICCFVRPLIQSMEKLKCAYVIMALTKQYKSVWGWKTQHGHLLALFAAQLFSLSTVQDTFPSVLNSCYQSPKLL